MSAKRWSVPARSAPRRKTHARIPPHANRAARTGKHQFDIGIEYTITENEFPILRD